MWQRPDAALIAVSSIGTTVLTLTSPVCQSVSVAVTKTSAMAETERILCFDNKCTNNKFFFSNTSPCNTEKHRGRLVTSVGTDLIQKTSARGEAAVAGRDELPSSALSRAATGRLFGCVWTAPACEPWATV